MPYYCKAKCPECGTELTELLLEVFPPIRLAQCPKCGFSKKVEEYAAKPPIGCRPYYVNISERICELCESIKRYSTEKCKYNQIKLWATEILYLNEMDRLLDRTAREKTWVEEKDGTLREVE